MPGDAQPATTSAGRLIEFLYPTRSRDGVDDSPGRLALVFSLLFLVDDLAGRSPFAIDSWIEQRIPWWSRIARTARGTA